MSKFLLVGAPKIGKSVAAPRIANALGCTSIKYEWNGIDELADDSLAVSTMAQVAAEDVDTSIVVLFVDSVEALQTLVKCLEHQPVTPKQLSIAKQLADIACWLDAAKNTLPQDTHIEAAEHVAKLHCFAEFLAGDRKAEIYSPEDATPPAQTCAHHPV